MFVTVCIHILLQALEPDIYSKARSRLFHGRGIGRT